ncbi:MAG: FxsA family protein, partial [bacterium]
FIAEILFLIPGFLTDAIAILFLIPFLNYFLLFLIFKYIKKKFKGSFGHYSASGNSDSEELKKKFIIFKKF